MKKKEEKKNTTKQDNGKLVGLLSYLFIGIIWYFVDENIKKSKFAKFHVKQALMFYIIVIGLEIILSILSYFLFFITGILYVILEIFFVVLLIIGLINANNNEMKELPIIGSYADQYLKF